MIDLNLKGKKALVTGASRGIGKTIALELARHGADVAVNYRCSLAEANDTVRGVEATGSSGWAIQADVTIEEDAKRLVQQATQYMGSIDILVNNTGEFFFGPMMQTTTEDFNRVLQSNLSSVFHMCKAVIPGMSGQGGSIVNIGLSPVDRVRGAANVGVYSIAKTGVLILTRTLAVEVAQAGIRMNFVSPGLIDNGHLPVAQAEWMRERVPFGRLGTSAEVAAAVIFLVSPAASYISGSGLEVSGAWDWLNRPVDHDSIVGDLFGGTGQP
jgi:NAD(P)-dependent dehydrogenase (short-subunit alcohol dehydrogenase family)